MSTCLIFDMSANLIQPWIFDPQVSGVVAQGGTSSVDVTLRCETPTHPLNFNFVKIDSLTCRLVILGTGLSTLGISARLAVSLSRPRTIRLMARKSTESLGLRFFP